MPDFYAQFKPPFKNRLSISKKLCKWWIIKYTEGSRKFKAYNIELKSVTEVGEKHQKRGFYDQYFKPEPNFAYKQPIYQRDPEYLS